MIAQPMPTNPTLLYITLPTNPTQTVVIMTATQMPVAKPESTTAKPSLIPVTVYNLAQGKFKEIPYPIRKSQEDEGPSAPSGNNTHEDQQPKAAATATALQNREDTPWPNTFIARASWPILPNETSTAIVIKTEKAEARTPPKLAAIPCAMVNKPPQSKAEEMCGWGLYCPICTKSTLKPKEGSFRRLEWQETRHLQRNYYPQSPQYSPSYDILDRFSQQYKLEKEWNERMEHLNDKYNLHYYSSSDSYLESELEHKYETLI